MTVGDARVTEAVLRAEGLGFSYGSHRALEGIDVTYGVGVHGVLGPNGAGKTTLLRILATVTAPQSGRVLVEGRDPWVGGALHEIRGRIGYVPQRSGFYPRHTVARFVDYVAILNGIGPGGARTDEVERVLTVVGLFDRAGTRIGALSGGMRQRLAVACGLVGDPPVVVLDEPTVGLDPEQRASFRELVSTIGVDHVVVLSTHQTEDVAALCRDVDVLDGGHLLFRGSAEEIVEKARGRVWESDRKEGSLSGWLSGGGRWRNLGDPPSGVTLLEPSVEDGYLVVLAEAGVLQGVRG